MSLFQRRPNQGETVQFYTFGQNKVVLIAGLGNVGKEYDGTRHNIGFKALDAFAKSNEFTPWVEKKDMKCHLATATLGETRAIIIKPTTFMNRSGEAVQAVAHFYKVPGDKILVVHDELDIPFGQIRLRIGGSSAGHNGLRSIIGTIGEGFGRVRVGIGPKAHEQQDSADFVLARFSKDQEGQMSALTRETSAILSEYAYGDGQLFAETRNFLV